MPKLGHPGFGVLEKEPRPGQQSRSKVTAAVRIHDITSHVSMPNIRLCLSRVVVGHIEIERKKRIGIRLVLV